MAVHRKLGPAHREHIYQRSLQDQIAQAGIFFEAQKLYEVYDGKNSEMLLGNFIPDFVVDEKVVVEIKAIQALDNSHLAQVIGYLTVTNSTIGLLVNFGQKSL